ncbi:MAG: FAD:protein FMN transferase [Inhella sp.]
MGTPCELRLEGPPERVREWAELVIAEVRRLEARYSRYREDSVLSAINRVAARGGSVTVDAETAALLDYAQTCHAQSGGRFDISSGLLRRAWRPGGTPAPDALHTLLQRVGWQRLRWERPHLHFDCAGMELDFGGIVKEYAVDRTASLLMEAGARHGLVNLGGDLRVFGPQANGRPWRIGIQHPRDPDALLLQLELSQGALASSEDYARGWVIDGQRYGHLLDPRSGWPVRHLAAVSVLAPLCVVAGSAASIGMLMDAQGPRWLADLGLEHIWVDAQGRQGGSLAPASSEG